MNAKRIQRPANGNVILNKAVLVIKNGNVMTMEIKSIIRPVLEYNITRLAWKAE